MREIFTDLYKKVVGFFQTQDKMNEGETSNAKDVAVNRMRLVLMQDRTNLTPFLLEKMRGEMIDVLAKYVEMDKEALELNFEQEGDQMALMLSIPVIRAKDEDEIKAVLEAEEEAKTNAEAEESDEEESTEFEDESEDEQEEIEAEVELETCSEPSEDEASESPDEIEEVEEEVSSKKSRKRK